MCNIDYNLSLISVPNGHIVSIEEAKLFLRIDGTDDDTMLASMLYAVEYSAEEYLGRSLGQKQWRLRYYQQAPEFIELPMGPIIRVNSVILMNYAYEETLLDESMYRLEGNRVMFHTPIIASQIVVTYEAGYEDINLIPPPIKHGLLIHLAHLYDDKTSDTGIPESALVMLGGIGRWFFRDWGVGCCLILSSQIASVSKAAKQLKKP